MGAKAARNLEKRRKAGVPDPPKPERQKAWIQGRLEKQQQITSFEQNSANDKKNAEDATAKIKKEITSTEEKKQKSESQKAEVEKDFAKARVEAEKHDIVHEQVERIKGQTKTHATVRDALETELYGERDTALRVEAETSTKRQKLNELQKKYEEVEARIKKKFSTGMSPEDVIALRRQDKRQQREILDLNAARSQGVSFDGLKLAPAINENINSIIEGGHDARIKAAEEAAQCAGAEEEGGPMVAKTSTMANKATLDAKEDMLSSLVDTREDQLSQVWNQLGRAQSGLL